MDAQKGRQLRGQVVYVEDDPVSVTLIQAVGQTFYPSVSFRFASTVAEGLERVLESPPDLLLLDMHLPDGSASDLIGQLLKARIPKHVPISLLTGETGGAELEAALRLGAAGYLPKPLNLAVFHAMLCKALADVEEGDPKP